MGGNVTIAAGDDGGGDAEVEGAEISGGDGLHQGGHLSMTAGDGGPNGKGGALKIGPGKYKGGDAKG